MELKDLRNLLEDTNAEPLNEWLLKLLPWFYGLETPVFDWTDNTGYDDDLWPPSFYYDNPPFTTPWDQGYEPGGTRYDELGDFWYVDNDGNGQFTIPPDNGPYDDPILFPDGDQPVDPTLTPHLPDEFLQDDPRNPDAWPVIPPAEISPVLFPQG